MIYSICVDSPLGTLTLSENKGKIIAIRFGKSEICGTIKETEVLLQCKQELEEYFRGERKIFTVALEAEGTDFQKKVWQALTEIPYGKTVTYGALAERIGCPGGARAVGAANHCNPLPILVPCHRVVGAGGNLTGYAGGMEMKKFLLELEQGKNHL